ncbi:MAG TPA: hypothetical protein DEA71_10020 [Nitrospira sp.]|nr:hypothetical protein [Nitrospira sp.]
MSIVHPFSWLPQSYRWYMLAVLFLAAATLAWKLSSQGTPLITAGVPNGILSYEFSWDKLGAEGILHSWNELKDVAREQLLWDYPFLIVYPLLLSLACGMMGDALGNAQAVVGGFAAWGVLLAGPLDAVENYALLRMLQSGASEGMAKAAWWCAGVKFVLVFSAIGCLWVGGTVMLVSKG